MKENLDIFDFELMKRNEGDRLTGYRTQLLWRKKNCRAGERIPDIAQTYQV